MRPAPRYQLVQFCPDPTRGELVNVAILGWPSDLPHCRVLAAGPAEQDRIVAFAPRTERLFRSVLQEIEALDGWDFEAVRERFIPFDPHLRISESMEISRKADFEAVLREIFGQFVGVAS